MAAASFAQAPRFPTDAPILSRSTTGRSVVSLHGASAPEGGSGRSLPPPPPLTASTFHPASHLPPGHATHHAAHHAHHHATHHAHHAHRASASARAATASVARASVRQGLQSVTDGAVEAELIKNLQTQVYYLELEANFLRDELKKAGTPPPLQAGWPVAPQALWPAPWTLTGTRWAAPQRTRPATSRRQRLTTN